MEERDLPYRPIPLPQKTKVSPLGRDEEGTGFRRRSDGNRNIFLMFSSLTERNITAQRQNGGGGEVIPSMQGCKRSPPSVVSSLRMMVSMASLARSRSVFRSMYSACKQTDHHQQPPSANPSPPPSQSVGDRQTKGPGSGGEAKRRRGEGAKVGRIRRRGQKRTSELALEYIISSALRTTKGSFSCHSLFLRVSGLCTSFATLIEIRETK